MKKIFLTIDIECHDINKYNYYIEGKIGNDYYGLEKILKICDEENIVLNCFVDFAECHRYGDEYIIKILDLINKYKQPVFLHLHPNFITGDDTRSFLWQYSYEEQKEILRIGFEDYKRFTGKDCQVFRVGRYGCDENMYTILSEYKYEIIDLSYCYSFNSMCHYFSDNYNAPFKLENITVMPNTRYCSFNIFGKRKFFNFDIPGTNVFEYKKLFNANKLNFLVCTMHSWSLIKKSFFDANDFMPDKKAIKKMYKISKAAAKYGWVFSEIDTTIALSSEDNELNFCTNPFSYLMEMIGTFIRIGKLTRTNKKYRLLYTLFYFSLFILLILIIILIVGL